MATDKVIPFDKNYVIDITLKHILRDIDISIDKTSTRIPEFMDDSDKTREVYETLSELHAMRRGVKNMLNRK